MIYKCYSCKNKCKYDNCRDCNNFICEKCFDNEYSFLEYKYIYTQYGFVCLECIKK